MASKFRSENCKKNQAIQGQTLLQDFAPSVGSKHQEERRSTGTKRGNRRSSTPIPRISHKLLAGTYGYSSPGCQEDQGSRASWLPKVAKGILYPTYRTGAEGHPSHGELYGLWALQSPRPWMIGGAIPLAPPRIPSRRHPTLMYANEPGRRASLALHLTFPSSRLNCGAPGPASPGAEEAKSLLRPGPSPDLPPSTSPAGQRSSPRADRLSPAAAAAIFESGDERGGQRRRGEPPRAPSKKRGLGVTASGRGRGRRERGARDRLRPPGFPRVRSPPSHRFRSLILNSGAVSAIFEAGSRGAGAAFPPALRRHL